MDRIGRFLSVNEQLGESIDIPFGYIKDFNNLAKIEWFVLSHKEVDGIGGLITILNRLNRPNAFIIPTLNKMDRPKFFVKLKAFLKVLKTPLPSTPIKKLCTNVCQQLKQENALVFHVFSKEATKKITERAKLKNISLNTFLLYCLNKAIARFFAASEIVSWRLPVNMRGAVKAASITENQWSFIQIIFKKNISPNELHNLIKNHLIQKEHWGYWWLGNVLGSLSARFVLQAAKKDITNGFFLTGVFSNLGELASTSSFPLEAFIAAAPVVKTVPISGNTLIWAQKLSITLQLHPSICDDKKIADAILETWINYLNSA